MVFIQETEFCSVVDSCFTSSVCSLHRLSHEYSKHGLSVYATHGKNQQEGVSVWWKPRNSEGYCKWSGRRKAYTYQMMEQTISRGLKK